MHSFKEPSIKMSLAKTMFLYHWQKLFNHLSKIYSVEVSYL